MGFEQAGHTCVYSIEWDKHKRKIYEVIFGNEPEASDIRAIRGSDLPISDCWTFGAPCQDFSIAGQRSGLDGDRSSLVREVFRLVREVEEKYRPEWLLYENVKGMLSSNKGLDYLKILYEMASLGYDIEYELLNSKDFGVPQNRERVYTLGHSRRYGERKIFPISRQSNEYSTIGKSAETAVARTLMAGGHSGGNHSGMTILRQPIAMSQNDCMPIDTARTLCAAGPSKGRGKNQYVNGVCEMVEPQVKQIGNVMPTATRDNPNQGRVYDPDGLAPCLNKMEGGGREPLILQTAHGYNKGGIKDIAPSLTKSSWQDNNHLLRNSRIRRLTPKECGRLQGVSDYITDKLIEAGISDTQLYRAFGDACTVNVIYEVAKRM